MIIGKYLSEKGYSKWRRLEVEERNTMTWRKNLVLELSLGKLWWRNNRNANFVEQFNKSEFYYMKFGSLREQICNVRKKVSGGELSFILEISISNL